MFTRLVESRRTRERSVTGMAASVTVHAAVIGVVCYATASARPAPHGREHIEQTVLYRAPEHPRPVNRTARTGSRGAGEAAPQPVLPTVDKIPVGVSVPTPDIPSGWDGELVTEGDFTSNYDGSRSSGSGGSGDGIAGTVDVPARPLEGNPEPVYPQRLRSLGVEGRVAARFVIDTAGRVEPQSIAWADGSNALFEEAVRRALLASRFAPARVGTRAVRMSVTEEFTFELRGAR